MIVLVRWLGIGLALGVSVSAFGGMRRVAVVVGNDRGGAAEPALRYAEDDAARIAQVLSDLGGVAASDLTLLLGRSGDEVSRALQGAAQRLADIRRQSGDRTLLLFYFSGHSDGEALELGSDRLSYASLRAQLARSGADVRVAIVDSCRSGVLLSAKGARLGPGFDIQLGDDPPTSGQVFVTSSASTEDALESRELRGSVFTHHLVSGLRGAADSSGDGRVTLAEAYHYAYVHTVAATSRLLAHPQHPSYDYQLSGVGELTLTELSASSALLSLPTGFDRAVVDDPKRDEVLAEIPGDAPRRIALPPGDYVVRLWRGEALYETQVTLRPNVPLTLAAADVRLVPLAGLVRAKGGDSPDSALKRAIDSFEALQNERAAEDFRALLSATPPPPDRIAAKAHVYLGLIAFNALRAADARREFRAALELDAAVDLPPSAESPKARVAFAQAQRDAQEAPMARHEEQPLGAPIAALAVVAPPPPPAPRTHAVGWALVGGAVVAAALAVTGAVEVANTNSQLSAAGAAAGTVEARSINYGAAQVWQVAWPIATGLAVAAGVGAVLTW